MVISSLRILYPLFIKLQGELVIPVPQKDFLKIRYDVYKLLKTWPGNYNKVTFTVHTLNVNIDSFLFLISIAKALYQFSNLPLIANTVRHFYFIPSLDINWYKSIQA